jgi:hypothetical protein
MVIIKFHGESDEEIYDGNHTHRFKKSEKTSRLGTAQNHNTVVTLPIADIGAPPLQCHFFGPTAQKITPAEDRA